MTTQQSAFTAPAGTGPALNRLPLYRNPLRLVASASPWRSAGFLFGYLAVGWIYVSVVFALAWSTVLLAVTLIGIPVIVAAAAALRGCAEAERWRLRGVLGEHIRGGYRPVTAPGIIAQVRTRWRDPATWRDLVYLGGVFLPLYVLDFVVLMIWLLFLIGVTVPAWYWAPEQTFGNGVRAHGIQFGYFPNGPRGAGATGFYVDTLPKALLTAGVFLVLFVLFTSVLVMTARMHARLAWALLGPPSDPLAEAREVLSRPGPLPPLVGGAEHLLTERCGSDESTPE
jgi:Putative sensor